jgi:hypothetical protein
MLLAPDVLVTKGGLDESLPLAEALWELYRRLRAEGFILACARGVYVHHDALTDDEGARHDGRTAAAQPTREVATGEAL